MVFGKLTDIYKKMKLDYLLIPYKNKVKMNERLKIKTQTTKVLEESIGSKISDISHSNIFFYYIFLGKGNKRKNKQMGLYQTKKFLHSKGNHQQNEKTTHWMGDHIFQLYIW